jgi:DNA mismatch repair ATPase MutS
MCGVPYRTVASYIGRLIERGHKLNRGPDVLLLAAWL